MWWNHRKVSCAIPFMCHQRWTFPTLISFFSQLIVYGIYSSTCGSISYCLLFLKIRREFIGAEKNFWTMICNMIPYNGRIYLISKPSWTLCTQNCYATPANKSDKADCEFMQRDFVPHDKKCRWDFIVSVLHFSGCCF